MPQTFGKSDKQKTAAKASTQDLPKKNNILKGKDLAAQQAALTPAPVAPPAQAPTPAKAGGKGVMGGLKSAAKAVGKGVSNAASMTAGSVISPVVGLGKSANKAVGQDPGKKVTFAPQVATTIPDPQKKVSFATPLATPIVDKPKGLPKTPAIAGAELDAPAVDGAQMVPDAQGVQQAAPVIMSDDLAMRLDPNEAQQPKVALNDQLGQRDDAQPDQQVVAPQIAQAAPQQQQQQQKALGPDFSVDDANTVNYLTSKGSMPVMHGHFRSQAEDVVTRLEQSPHFARYAATMTRDEMFAVALYTTNAAYAINAILRGLVQSSYFTNAFGGYAGQIASALAKVPEGVRNGSAGQGQKIDDSLGDDAIVSVGTLYRNDSFEGAFTDLFASDYKVGRSLQEPGFFSTSTNPNAYPATVTRTIKDCKVGRSVADLSAQAQESEILLPPGQRFEIESMRYHRSYDTDGGTAGWHTVDDPMKTMPLNDFSNQAFNSVAITKWDVQLKHVGVAKGKKPEAGKKGESSTRKDSKAAKPMAPVGTPVEAPAVGPSNALERYLGMM